MPRPAFLAIALLAALSARHEASAQSRFFSGSDAVGLRTPTTYFRQEAFYQPQRRPVYRPRGEDDVYTPEPEDRQAPYDAPDLNVSRPTVPGNRAVLKRGIAHAPENAPENIKQAIWAVNTLRRLPYKWGGGHGSFRDTGYDCSGTVSFALHHAGLLRSPMPSSGFKDWGDRGRGRWITVYAQRGHVFAVIAGLRLDTTGFRSKDGPRWRSDARSGWGFTARHYVGF